MDKILILDFGSQVTQLIGRRLRELNVYCEIYPYNKVPAIDDSVKGVILSGSPCSVLDDNAPQVDLTAIRGRLPLLGICYGAQYLAHIGGGKVEPSRTREYGRALLRTLVPSPLLKGVSPETQVWMSHGDSISSLPKGAEGIASTQDVVNAAYEFSDEPTYAVQFHPEVYHTTEGARMLSNFAIDICGCKGDWTPDSFIETTVASLRKQIGDEKVILGLSGGVDSTVAAVLLHKAIGSQLTCIFVNNGLLRKNEFGDVLAAYKEKMGLHVIGADASDAFLQALKGVSDPETKRKIIGRLFVETFEQYARQIENARWLAQGTIYPDVIESAGIPGIAAKIKSHHNVGGLPEKMNLKVVEPLKMLFKDEVRRVGRALGIPASLVGRHPFPGPSLAIRIIGEVTEAKLSVLREADDIFIRSLRSYDCTGMGYPSAADPREMATTLYDAIWQAGVILLPVRSVGVMGDERTYENPVALRAVVSTDAMTADWFPFPYDFLADVSNEIIRKVRGVNRVVYDISSKPPATIEWE